jgi:hypothetical protein
MGVGATGSVMEVSSCGTTPHIPRTCAQDRLPQEGYSTHALCTESLEEFVWDCLLQSEDFKNNGSNLRK